MSMATCTLLKRMLKIDARKFSTAIKVKDAQEEQLQTFRTIESDPTKHNESHLNRFYTIPSNIYNNLYHNNLPKELMRQVEVFGECSILVRQPAVEVISCLEQTDFSRPVNKYVLYGKFGVGKTVSMVHLIHYAYTKNFIILNIPWVNNWYRFPKEIANSTLFPDQFDLPIDAGMWLKYFRLQNQAILTTLGLKVSKDYEWSQRESTKKGAQLLELIDFGVNRIKYSCAVADALVDELKAASTAGKCKTFVSIDGYNAFTSDITAVKDDNKKFVSPKRLSLTTTFLKTTHYDWCNGAVLLSVDTRAVKDKRESEYPKYLLGKEGFEYLDPFLPIPVENYTLDEFETTMEYYKNRKWVREISELGQKELETLSNRNPFSVFECCKPL